MSTTTLQAHYTPPRPAEQPNLRQFLRAARTNALMIADDQPVMPKPIVTTQPDHAPAFFLSART